MKKKLIVATLVPLFLLSFVTELSFSQSVNNIEQPQEQITKDEKSETINNNYIIMQATAYTKSIEEGTHKGITASGVLVDRGIVATDPKVIPLGTKLYVEEYGYAIALDTGGVIKGNKIDLYMETKKEAFEFGRKDIKVWIIG